MKFVHLLVDVVLQEKRVVTKRSGEKDSNTRSDQEKDPCESGSRSSLGVGRGRRRQLLVTTPGNIKARICESVSCIGLDESVCVGLDESGCLCL